MNEIQRYYSGFVIREPLGNNAFSFQERENRQIYVPALKQGSLDDLACGEKIVFSEIQDGVENNCRGLRNFLHLKRFDQDILIFDNHNHAFFFWIWAVTAGKLEKGLPLVHFDQHKDMREPAEYFKVSKGGQTSLKEAFDYTNFVLNVGNFLKPALKLEIFSDVLQINDSKSFHEALPKTYALDIDMDIFSPQLKYIDEGLKITKIKEALKEAKFITIATSPYFMEQTRAIELIKVILS